MPADLRLLVSCADRPGIVATVARFLHEAGANITRSYQHSTDPRAGTFFLRMEFDLAAAGDGLADLRCRFARDVASSPDMRWDLRSNHPDSREDVETFGVPYHHVALARTARPPRSGC